MNGPRRKLVDNTVYIRTSKVEKVGLQNPIDPKSYYEGTLHLTTSHLIFVVNDSRQEKWVPLSLIQSLEKPGMLLRGSPLTIRCKNFETLRFILPRDKGCQDVYMSLQKLSRPDEMSKLYCFHFKSPVRDRVPTYGWHLHNPADDFRRMGIDENHRLWQPSDINENYEICDTYPARLYFPTWELGGIKKHVLKASANFRSRGRLPTLSYLYDGKAALCRCSQPLTGFSARCVEDEQLLQAILKVNEGSAALHVVDTRPMVNALANRAQGKGYENDQVYKNIRFRFFDIENIHVMRGSLEKLLKVCEGPEMSPSAFLSGLERSGWLRHIRSVLDAASFVAKMLHQGSSVLVHCSDGWDRTAQTCSLAQLMLDPFYRTLVGFQVLIQKEWLSFGHKFTDRCGLLLGSVDASEQSPVFTQFLDCVWQLWHQRPQAFQFDERLLRLLHDEAHAARYGTFVGNCEKDRLDQRLHLETASLWGFLADRPDEFTNPLYRPESAPTRLEPNLAPQALRLWSGLFCRWEAPRGAESTLPSLLTAPRCLTFSLRSQLRLAQTRVRQLCLLLGKTEEEAAGKAAGLARSESLYTLKDLECGDVPGKSGPELLAHMVRYKEEEEESGFAELDSASSFSSCGTPGASINSPSCQRLVLERNSVAIEWCPQRAAFRCQGCGAPFCEADSKRHCWTCGKVFCPLCSSRRSEALPGLQPSSGPLLPAPVTCGGCSKEIARQLSSMQHS